MVKQLTGDAIDITPDDVTELEDDNDADLSAIFASFGGAPDDKTYHLKIYRVIKDSAERAWLFNAVPSELPIDNRLRDEYKGGRFEIRIYEIKGGKHILRRRPNILIEAPQKPEAAQASDLAAVLKAFQDSQTQMFNQLSDVMKKSQGVVDVPANPFSMMKEMAAAMVSMREMMQPAVQTNPIESLKGVIELAGMLKSDSGGGGDTNWLDVLKEAMRSPLLQNVMGAMPQMLNSPTPQLAAPSPTPQETVQSSVTPQPSSIPQPENTQDMNAMQLAYMTQYLEMLINRAAAQQNPEFVAELISNDIPEPVIKEHLLNPGALDKAAEINPGVNTHRQWFVQVQTALQALLATVT